MGLDSWLTYVWFNVISNLHMAGLQSTNAKHERLVDKHDKLSGSNLGPAKKAWFTVGK